MEDKIIPIYSGKPEDFCWVGFGSGSGTNLRECAKEIKPGLIFSDRLTAKLLDLGELSGVLKQVINAYEMCGSWKKAQGNPEAEAEYERKSIVYNERILDLLRNFESKGGINIDLIVLGGYMRLVKDPLLTDFEDRILNVHPAKLDILETLDAIRRTRKYIGEDAVYDAIKAGERKTASSVIIVDEEIDHGEILTQGPELAVSKEFLRLPKEEKEKQLRQYVDGTDDERGHQDIQKEVSDWPALTTALKMISEGRIGLGTEKYFFDEWRIVYVDGEPMGYGGFQVK